MDFEKLEKTDVTKHIDKKGKFSYLSWPFAVSAFRKACPEGTWRISHFGDSPYCITESGCFVEVTVFPDVANELLSFTQVHPVLDFKNKSVKEPDAFQINTSIQRCLVKAIALATGIGLHIYAGEDLPPDETLTKQQEQKLSQSELYGNWCAEADNNAKTAEKLGDWFVSVSAKAKTELDEGRYAKFKAYVTQLGKSLKEKVK
jgi:hypothetical protein